jgi:hypothetical protein
MADERSGPLQNSIKELISYLEDRLEHDSDGDDSEYLELYQALKKHGRKILKDERYYDILARLDDECTELYG